MAAGGKKRIGKKRKKDRTYPLGPSGPSGPSKLRTALERTSPKSAAALKSLEARQEDLSRRNAIRDEFGAKLDRPNFEVVDRDTGKRMTGLKKGGCVGDGCAIRGRTKGTMR